ncbi:MAG TPA: hypothetical protein DCF49_08895 [Lachnospiraceae bacterium]|nr:hypothetical protein [Lachnospiraceae bacterium]
MGDVYIYIVDLPDRVDEMVTPCIDGYTVYLNARLSYAGRVRAYLHAMRHIERNDFEGANVQEIETETHE